MSTTLPKTVHHVVAGRETSGASTRTSPVWNPATGEHQAQVLLAEAADDEGTSMRLLSVLGASAALGDHLVRHPDHWRELTDPTLGSTRAPAFAVRARLVQAVGADPEADEPVASLPYGEALDALAGYFGQGRLKYRESVVEGLENAPRGLVALLKGENFGKQLVKLA